MLFPKPLRVILWCPLSDFIFDTVERIGFFYFYRNDLSNFRAWIADAFRTIINCVCVRRRYPRISILSEIVLRKNISNNFRRLAMFYLKHFYSKALNGSLMNRDWRIFFSAVLHKMTVCHYKYVADIFHVNAL